MSAKQIAFDQEARQAMQRTVRWARSAYRHYREQIAQMDSRHALFPIVQGSMYADLRRECADSGRLRDEVKQPSITLDVRVDIHQAVAIEESNMLALVDGRPARMQRLGLLPISA